MAVVLSYHLSRNCGRSAAMCRRCTNSFVVDSCGVLPCGAKPPSTVCLSAETNVCSDCKNGVIPQYYRVTVSNGGPETELGTIRMGTGNLCENRFCSGLLSLGSDLKVVFCTFPTLTFGLLTYFLQTDITAGDGCNQTLVFNDNGMGDPSVYRLHPL